MGMDLHWIVTPKETEENLHFFDDGFFCQILNKEWEDRRDLAGREFGKKDLPELKTYLKVLESADGNNHDTIICLKEMIEAIEKHDSITIVARS